MCASEEFGECYRFGDEDGQILVVADHVCVIHAAFDRERSRRFVHRNDTHDFLLDADFIFTGEGGRAASWQRNFGRADGKFATEQDGLVDMQVDVGAGFMSACPATVIRALDAQSALRNGADSHAFLADYQYLSSC